MGHLTEQMRATSSPAQCWTAIRQRSCQIVIEQREIDQLTHDAEHLLIEAPFERRAAGPVEEALQELGRLPLSLAADIRALAHRFVDLMKVPQIRLRLEVITTDACRKIHADYTDVRLITTYCGPGTDYIPAGADLAEDNLQRLPAGAVALLKGRLFAEGHAPCFHRSPPVAASGARRLVLVIDTPLD